MHFVQKPEFSTKTLKTLFIKISDFYNYIAKRLI